MVAEAVADTAASLRECAPSVHHGIAAPGAPGNGGGLGGAGRRDGERLSHGEIARREVSDQPVASGGSGPGELGGDRQFQGRGSSTSRGVVLDPDKQVLNVLVGVDAVQGAGGGEVLRALDVSSEEKVLTAERKNAKTAAFEH